MVVTRAYGIAHQRFGPHLPGDRVITTSPTSTLNDSASASAAGEPIVLFTAFEPSGDAHAAPVIEALRTEAPEIQVFALGGDQMEAAGATCLSKTAEDGAMGTDSWKQAVAVRREVKRIRRWSRQHRVVLHVPVDAPAANFPIVKVLRKRGARTIHLVAPQVWAWGRRRINKLRRNTDLLLCLLPFEEQWFNERQVPARFIGHPAINRELDEAALEAEGRDLPSGGPRVALFPGSRTHEVQRNIRLLTAVFIELKSRFNAMSGLIIAANPGLARAVREKVPGFPTGLNMITGHADAAVHWCDLALTVSGTMSLQITRHHRPMVGVYCTGILPYLASKLVLKTPYRLLPNIIAEREIVPEFVPYAGGPDPVVAQAFRYLNDSKHAAVLAEQLRRVCLRFANKQPAREAAGYLVRMVRDGAVK